MSDTPRTSKMIAYAPIGLKINPAFNQAFYLCEQLEIELNAANERIKRLVQAGDCLLSHRNSTDYHEKVREWDKAKKDKP